jgi:hypothetical protein
MFKRVIPQAIAWAGLVVLCGVLALAQGAATPSSPADPVRTDGQIEMDVVHALDASTVLKNDLITAATIQGEVTLSGTVAVTSSRDLAESIAGQVQGVTKVHNNLKVGNSQSSQSAQGSAGGQQGDAGAPNSAASPDGHLTPPDESDAQAQLRAQIRAEVIAEIRAQRQAQQQAHGQDPSSPDEYQPVPPPQAQEAPKGPVTIPQGTLLQLRTSEPVGTKHAKDGEQVQFTVIRDVTVGGVLAIPRGATAHGVVTEVKKAGDLGGSPELALKLTSLDLGGQDYPLDSGLFKVKGPNKAGRTVGSALTGGMMGTIIGCAAGRGMGCAIGAGAGVAAGTAASAASPGPNIWIPAEAQVAFHLNSPLTVTPVSAREAARLAQGLYRGGPALYRRGYGAYAQSYPYAYEYPPVYYHPYYAVGGYYYWR